MSFDTPLVEYLIIGSHVSSWILLVAYKLMGQPLEKLKDIDPSLVLLSLPFIYLVGMTFDDIYFQALNRYRLEIKSKIKDEVLAYFSETLYSAYEHRVRRVRIVGGAIFNWPLLGLSILLHIGFKNYVISLLIVGISLVLSSISFWIWRNLYKRAYKFRDKAGEVVLKYANLEKESLKS